MSQTILLALGALKSYKAFSCNETACLKEQKCYKKKIACPAPMGGRTDISLRSRSEDWLRALEMGVNKKFPDGVRGKGLSLISDNGSQPTSRSFMGRMAILGIEQIFTSYDNPKGNAETERMMRTIKEEVVWLHEFTSLREAREVIGRWIEKYNREYVHSALGYLSPLEFEQKFYQNYYQEAA